MPLGIDLPMRKHNILLIITIALAALQVLLAIIGGRPVDPTKPAAITIVGRFKASADATLTVSLTKRRGLSAYLTNAAAEDITVRLTPQTLVEAIYQPPAGSGPSRPPIRQALPISYLVNDQLTVLAHEDPPGSRQLVADRVTAIRSAPAKPPASTTPQTEPPPTPGDLR